MAEAWCCHIARVRFVAPGVDGLLACTSLLQSVTLVGEGDVPYPPRSSSSGCVGRVAFRDTQASSDSISRWNAHSERDEEYEQCSSCEAECILASTSDQRSEKAGAQERDTDRRPSPRRPFPFGIFNGFDAAIIDEAPILSVRCAAIMKSIVLRYSWDPFSWCLSKTDPDLRAQ